ncbi:biotin--protein ligase 2-like isoform X1 [Typha latifolia]|uniref:biotin--protein ligase 2-like isoform X1 n=1 Tax=Typha latifolia TaxID=4733 RepID=UPI003C2B5E29
MPLAFLLRPSTAAAAAAAATAAAAFFLLRIRRPPTNRRFFSSLRSTMDGCRNSALLVISAKSPEEDVLARSLISKSGTLKLGDEEEIRVLLGSEVDSTNHSTFAAQLYMEALSASRFGRFLIWSPRLSSTHDLVTKNFHDLPLGTVCLADIQFKGRGRAKNVWESPAGCLLFSFTLQMEDGHKLPFLQYVVSLALTEAIKELCRAKGLTQLDVRIKWPNDIYLNGLKVGGILCTSTYRSKCFNVCAGIGLNVDNEKPTTCLNAALQEVKSTSHGLKREEILAYFFNKFENLLEIFLNQGFQVLEELYCTTWLHSGQKVVIQEKHEGQPVEDTVVTIQGLTSSGYLLATDEDNKTYELHPDGNSFDFFKGLVRRKME